MKYHITRGMILCIIICLGSYTITAQKYTAIDNAVRQYPKHFSNAKQLAMRISSDFSTEEDRVRAAFSWIAFNITYDIKLQIAQSTDQQIAFYYTSEEERQMKQIKFQRDLTNKTIKSGMGVCQGYAALFHTVCDFMGIECLDIAGTSKSNTGNIGLLPKASDHVWNAVKVWGEWKLMDITWAAGAMDGRTNRFVRDFNDAYYFTSPAVFFLNHYPDDINYLYVGKTEQEFAQLPLYYGSYLTGGYQFVSPATGIFSDTKSDIIPFKITDLPENDRVSYAFSDQDSGSEAIIRRSGNVSEFEIPMTNRNRGFLTVYVNGSSVVSYKIQR